MLIRQRGITLVSMMVGLLISVLVILVLLTSFRTLLSVSAQATRSAIQDGELATAMTALQMDIQAAGFGLDSTAVLQATVDLPGADRALLWRFQDGAQPVCAGVVERSAKDPESGRSMRVVSRLTSDNCSAASALDGLSWSLGEDLLQFREQTARQLRIVLGEGVCSPFGALAGAERHPIVTLTAPSSTAQAGAAALPVSYSVCLINIPA
ncbi:hypothetical protein D3C76_684680 [compost metagenome]